MQDITRTKASLGKCQSVTALLWPSFIVSGIATIIFFTLFDPLDLIRVAGLKPVSSIAAYSIGFFSFWIITILSSAGTQYFMKPCDEINRKAK